MQTLVKIKITKLFVLSILLLPLSCKTKETAMDLKTVVMADGYEYVPKSVDPWIDNTFIIEQSGLPIDKELPKDYKRLDLSNMEVIEKPTSGGNQRVYILQNSTREKKYVLKFLDLNERMKEEILAGKIYRKYGANVPQNRCFYIDSETQLPKNIENHKTLHDAFRDTMKNPNNKSKVLVSISEYIDGNYLYEVLPTYTMENAKKTEDLSEPQQQILKQIYESYVLDCLLGNRDITVGFKNIMVDKNLKAYRFDNGSALRYKALGAKKDTKDLYSIEELNSMRNPEINKDGSILYKFITNDEIRKQIEQILKNPELLWNAYEEVQKQTGVDENNEIEIKDILLKRLQYLSNYYLSTMLRNYVNENQTYEKVDSKGVVTENTAAGMLNYTTIDEKVYVLLGERIRHDYWGNLGGSSEPKYDKKLSETAAREVKEESNGIIDIQPLKLEQYSSHEIVGHQNELDLRPKFKNDKTIKSYKMYMVPTEFISHEILEESLKNAEKGSNREYTQFTWVNLNDIINAISATGINEVGNSVELKNVNTSKGIKDIKLHWPLYCMLRQGPVLHLLNNINKKKIPTSHTIGSIRLSNDIAKQAISLHPNDIKGTYLWDKYPPEEELINTFLSKNNVISELKTI